MNFIKRRDIFGLNITLEEDGKYLVFSFGGNGDLYWSIHNSKVENVPNYSYDYFIITKENYNLFRLFEVLYEDIQAINIFDRDIMANPFMRYTNMSYQEYLEERKRRIEEEKIMFREHNRSNYNQLFDEDNKTITWYSDETANAVSNFLKIKKEEDTFKIEFYTQPYIAGYDMDFHSKGYIPIRFRNSGSSYEPFNLVFMRMYRGLANIDDVREIGHQIHLEEYLYNKEKPKQLNKKK